MEEDQQFCLRWNNHQSTLISVFDTLFDNGKLVDCTLAAEGQFVKAHKVVLSACSPYFATLLTEQYDKHPIFILKDVKYQELRAMMDYMYRGEVNISQDQLAALLKAAESLQIKGLSDNRSGGDNSQKTSSAEHKHVSVPGKANVGYTLEQTKRARLGPSSAELHDVAGSREGSSSPTGTRKRRKIRRRSVDNVMADNHENSNSSQSIQINSSVPSSNVTGTISTSIATGPAVGGASSLPQGAGNLIASNVTKKTENVSKMGSNNDAITAADNEQNDEHDKQIGTVKKDQNHKRSSKVINLNEKETDIVIEPKSEYDDDGNDETVEDLTLDDEDMGLEDLDQAAGPSHGGEGSSQGYAQWQVDRSQDEVFMAAQEAQQRDPQDLRTLYNISSISATSTPTTSVTTGLFEPEITIRKLYKCCTAAAAAPSSSISTTAPSPPVGMTSCSGCTITAAAAAAASIQLANFIGSAMLLPTDISNAVSSSASIINPISSSINTKMSLTAPSSLSSLSSAAAISTSQPPPLSSSPSASSIPSLSLSMLTAPKKNATQFDCSYCTFSCSWKYDLKLHLRQKHGLRF